MSLYFGLDGKRRVIFYIYRLAVFSEWATIEGIGKRATLITLKRDGILEEAKIGLGERMLFCLD